MANAKAHVAVNAKPCRHHRQRTRDPDTRARGLSNSEISRHLTLSMATVKTHVSSLLTKLTARDRTQLVIRLRIRARAARRLTGDNPRQTLAGQRSMPARNRNMRTPGDLFRTQRYWCADVFTR